MPEPTTRVETMTSPVVAAFIAPNTSVWRGAMVNVCADGSWWARGAEYGDDAPWERQAPPLHERILSEAP